MCEKDTVSEWERERAAVRLVAHVNRLLWRSSRMSVRSREERALLSSLSRQDKTWTGVVKTNLKNTYTRYHQLHHHPTVCIGSWRRSSEKKTNLSTFHRRCHCASRARARLFHHHVTVMATNQKRLADLAVSCRNSSARLSCLEVPPKCRSLCSRSLRTLTSGSATTFLRGIFTVGCT